MQICDIFSTGGQETFYFVRANPEYPDFFISYSVNIIAELCPSVLFVRCYTYQGEFFASEVAHF